MLLPSSLGLFVMYMTYRSGTYYPAYIQHPLPLFHLSHTKSSLILSVVAAWTLCHSILDTVTLCVRVLECACVPSYV